MKKTPLKRKTGLKRKTKLKAKSKATPKKKLHAKAWELTSQYVRLRDSNGTTHAKCCTCERPYPIYGRGCLQAGHFIPGRMKTGKNMYDERGIHAQCHQCNVYFKGAPIEYMEFMQAKYGYEVIQELVKQSRDKVFKFSTEYLEAVIELRKKQIAQLGGWNPPEKG